ncbi:MAG: DUF3352 domain-containing protein, partial [Anaerolineae bacterium]|nr:DUF3352 domain-containing protein [Anaerolineae bacterium]
MKRIHWILPLLLLCALPVAAQTPSPLDWIPADFSAFVRINMTNPTLTLGNLDIGLFVASVIQPARAQYAESQDFDPFFPLDSFDVESVSFTRDVLPWLEDEMIIAYRSLGAQFEATAADALMIFPVANSLQAANALSPIIQAQDFLQRDSYRGMNVYEGDKTSFGFTPFAALIGPVDLIHAAIDTLLGDAPALTSDPVYQQVSGALDVSSALVYAYLSQDTASRALSVLMSGSDAADPLLAAVEQSLGDLSDDRTPERLLLSGAVDGVGIGVQYDRTRPNLRANVILHTTDAPDASDTAFDPAVLDLIPRSAMIVQSGTDAGSAATDALYALPLLNFAGDALGAFPVFPSAASQILPVPTADDVQSAVADFLDTVKPVVDVQNDVLAQLDGSYSVALLPRPNNPVPVLNAPFDVLLVVQTESAEAAQSVRDSADKLLETFVAPLEDEQLDEQDFRTLRAPGTGEPVLRVGTVDNMVVIGTGSAAQLALDARRGDNRLTAQQRWQNLSQDDQIPYIYVDINAYYNTFLPTLGGPAVRPVSQMGVQSRYLG